MQHLIAFNGFRGGNKGSASCQPLSEYDKTISLPWLHEMVLQIRGEKSIRSVDRADEAKIAKAQQRIKGQLPFRCAHYYRFLKNRRAQDCKMRFFGDAIKKAEKEGAQESKKGPASILALLPDEFSFRQVESLRAEYEMSAKGTAKMLRNWMSRGYIQIKENDSVTQKLSDSETQ